MANINATTPKGQDVDPQTSTVLNYALPAFTDGMISDGTVGYTVVSPKSLSYLENVHNDVNGVLRTRTELQDFNAQGLPSYPSSMVFDDASTPTGASLTYAQRLLLQIGTNMYSLNPYTNTTPSLAYSGIATLGYRLRYDKYQGRIVYASLAQPLGYIYSPTSSQGTIAGLTGLPNNDLISIGFYGMVWSANTQDNTCTLYNSDPIITTVEAATYSTSSTLGASATKINVNNGDHITAFAKTQNALFVFTNSEIRRVFAPGNYDLTPVIRMGTPTQECVVSSRVGYFFYNVNGIFQLTPSSQYSTPEAVEVSYPIRDFIRKNVTSDTEVRSWADQDNVYFSLGEKIDKNGKRTTIVVKYNFVLKTWSTYKFQNKSFQSVVTQFSQENASSTTSQYNPVTYIGGFDNTSTPFVSRYQNIMYATQDTDAKVDGALISDPVVVRGTSIYYDIQTHWLEFDIPQALKRITGFYATHDGGEGAGLYVKYDDDDNEWQLVGMLDENIVTTFRQVQTDVFYRCKIRIAGNGRGVVKNFYNLGLFIVDYQGYNEA